MKLYHVKECGPTRPGGFVEGIVVASTPRSARGLIRKVYDKYMLSESRLDVTELQVVAPRTILLAIEYE